ncbi:YutD family protein [Paenibacillus sp. P25]|nr:YutD family protein [Paenibacillus sp. P25]
MIQIANRTYEVIVDHKNGWKPEAFRDRYSEVLDRYDYIVGDWGYSQLRLRGFFKENHPKATKETSIATLQDYLNEYCNFGCAYFIIEKMPAKVQGRPGKTSASRRPARRSSRSPKRSRSRPSATSDRSGTSRRGCMSRLRGMSAGKSRRRPGRSGARSRASGRSGGTSRGRAAGDRAGSDGASIRRGRTADTAASRARTRGMRRAAAASIRARGIITRPDRSSIRRRAPMRIKRAAHRA